MTRISDNSLRSLSTGLPLPLLMISLIFLSGIRGYAATVSGEVSIPPSDGGWAPSTHTMYGASVRVEGTEIEAALVPTSAAMARFTLTEVPRGTVTLVLDEGTYDAAGLTPYDAFTLSSKRVSVAVDQETVDGVSFALAYHWQELGGYPSNWGAEGYGEWTPHFVSDQVGFLLFRVRGAGIAPERMELYRTIDAGQTWSEIGHWAFDAAAFAAGSPHPAYWRSFHFLDADRGVVLATVSCIPCGGCGSGFFYTDDGGTTWQYTTLATPGIAYAIGVQKYASTGGEHLIAAGTVGCGVQGYNNGFYDAVWDSIDGGATWSPVWESALNQSGGIQALGASVTGSAVAFRGGTVREFLLRDSGGTWTSRDGTGMNVASYDIPMVGDEAWLAEYLGTPPNGTYHSDDAGQTWLQRSDGVVQSFGFGSSRKGFAQAGGPALATYDGGANWVYQSAGGAVVGFNQVWAFDEGHAVWTEGGYSDPNGRSQLFSYVEPWQADFEIVDSSGLADLEVTSPEQDIPMAGWQLRNNGPVSVHINSLALDGSGTGDERVDVDRIEVWLDPEGDGSLGTQDVPLGSAVYGNDDGTAVLHLGAPLELHPRTPLHLLVTYDLAASLNNLKTFSFSLQPGAVDAEAADAGAAVAPTAPSGHVYPSRTLTFLAYADLKAQLTCAPDPVTSGDPLTYTAIVSNLGPDSAANVTLTDALAAQFNFVSATPTQGVCTYAAGTMDCTLGDLAMGETARVTLVVTPLRDGSFPNAVTAAASEIDPEPSNDTANITATVDPAATNGGGGGGGGGCFLGALGDRKEMLRSPREH